MSDTLGTASSSPAASGTLGTAGQLSPVAAILVGCPAASHGLVQSKSPRCPVALNILHVLVRGEVAQSSDLLPIF